MSRYLTRERIYANLIDPVPSTTPERQYRITLKQYAEENPTLLDSLQHTDRCTAFVLDPPTGEGTRGSIEIHVYGKVAESLNFDTGEYNEN